MLWSEWSPLVPTLVASFVVLLWWLADCRPLHTRFVILVGCVFACWTFSPELTRDVVSFVPAACMTAFVAFQLDRFLLDNVTMIVTGAALVWLLKRAVQTLWKPVPDLITILGVEVPAQPDVSLTHVGVDKATVTWTRPASSRPVQKFLIQVNGVNVGESAANQDTFITVSGLKPDHFYNVRVIAVGTNNFQTGSRVMRLRTFGADGRPRLGNARLPSDFPTEDLPPRSTDAVDENGAPRQSVAAVAASSSRDEPSTPGRDTSAQSGGGQGQRRNTIGRRHSPSTTSLDQPPLREEPSDGSTAAQMAELNQRYLTLREETDEVMAAVVQEEDALREVGEALELEKQERRKGQRKKEEQTEKLKKEQGTTERAMRSALQRKQQTQKQLDEKKEEQNRLRKTIKKWTSTIEESQKEQDGYATQRAELEAERAEKAKELNERLAELRHECSGLEVELRERRQEVKQLEDARKQLPGGEEDGEWHGKLQKLKRERAQKDADYQVKLVEELKKAHHYDTSISWLSQQIQNYPQPNAAFYQQGNNTSGFEFEPGPQGHFRGQSGNSNTAHGMPLGAVPIYSGPPVSAAPGGHVRPRPIGPPPGFVPGPFMSMGFSADQPDADDADGRLNLTGGAPLSPSATSLLPSNIFTDDEPFGPAFRSPFNSLSPQPAAALPEPDPQSPASSGPSRSILSSPHGSTQHLPFPGYAEDANERHSLHGPMSSPVAAPGETSSTWLGGLNLFPRSRTKGPDDGGPALGSLKHGQSQSFPRQTDDDPLATKARRSFMYPRSMFNRNSTGPELLEGHASSSRFSARNLLPFGSRNTSSAGGPSSPRPTSLASSDIPRQSTDSASIWGPPAEGGILGKSRNPWTDNAWSRNASRRPSLHGSPSALKTNLASADDEILDEDELLNPQASPSQVGVIGSRPPGSKKTIAMTLNPAAPTFMTNLFQPKEKKKDKAKEKDHSKENEKSKGRDKDKHKSKDKGKGKEPQTPNVPSVSVEESPSEPRESKDGFSIHTQTSVSESRESLSLDQSLSNTPSEPTSGAVPSIKDSENSFRKLFRKDSTSRLSIARGIKWAGGRNPSSGNNSDKNGGERSSFGDMEDSGEAGSLGRSYDSVTSSPSLGPASFKSSGGRDKPESKLKSSASWFGIKKKNKEKDSLEIDRERHSISETEAPSEDGK